MMPGRDSDAVAGGPARHIPVLGAAALEALNIRDGGIYVDGTLGAGGHTRAILAAGDTRVIAIDRDRSAIAGAADLVDRAGTRLTAVEEKFSELEAVVRQLGHDAVDGVLLDIGVSSMQLDEAERGFSFRQDGPLDMRMGGDGPSAADLVEHATARDLAFIIATLGEENFARPIARAIVAERSKGPIVTTRALADVVGRIVHARPGAIHPATRTFQALRMFVNDELGELARALAAAERILSPSGRLAVISFHSLEDRIVKNFLIGRSRTNGGSRHLPEVEHPAPSFQILTKRPLVADETEIAANPRARSAKLRVAERTDAPAIDAEIALPRLPSLDQVLKGG
jgi:16S rRNA (cytosine1402-N4)-methyltransferase